jgi:hypothetical protein
VLRTIAYFESVLDESAGTVRTSLDPAVQTPVESG